MSRSRFGLTALAAMLLVAAPSLQAVDLQSIPGTATKLQVYGFVMVYGNAVFGATQAGSGSAASSLFYNTPADFGAAGSTPLDTGGLQKGTFNFSYAPTRFGFASTTPSASLGDVSTKIEYDFNGNSSHLRHAYIKVGGFTIGKAWSLWTDLDAGADTVDWAGAIGSACYDTPRLPVLQYAVALDKKNSIAVDLEQNTGNGDGATEVSGATSTTYAVSYPNASAAGPGTAVTTATTGPTAAAGKLTSKIPSLVAAYTYTDSWGHIALRGLAQNYSAFLPGSAAVAYSAGTSSSPAQPVAAKAVVGSTTFSKVEAAFQVSGDVKIAKDDLIFSIYNGKGLGQYGTGIQSVLINEATQTITAYKSTGWLAGYTHNWTDAVRSNLVVSGVNYSSDDAISTTNSANGTDIKSMTNAFVNTIVKLSKTTELGFEYVYETPKGFGPNSATDTDYSTKSSVNDSKFEVAFTAHF